MAENSKIEWTDHTFNPWIGCTAVSMACDFCYAEVLMDKRYGRVQWGPHGERATTGASTWRQPRLWQKRAADFFAEHGRRQRVFCASLADVFDNKAPEGVRDRLWQLIRETPDLDWLLLTKRPQNIAKMLPAFWDEIRGHVWLGTSTENQVEADRRLRHLLTISPRPAVFFASAEPLLGPIDFTMISSGAKLGEHDLCMDVLRGPADMEPGERLDWIIVGGESGPGARPTHPDWIRGIRDHCAATGTAFLFKQWGEWAALAPSQSGGWPTDEKGYCRLRTDGTRGDDGWPMQNVGKKFAGRVLFGITHDGFPEGHTHG